MDKSKIDFVITTVDGSDPEWRKKKNKYEGKEDVDDRDIRFREWDNLQYIFRGIEQFAPWVNKVYLVTDNQAPSWIDASYEKLVLVNHTDFIPEKYLPVFSSHPIEHNLFRIKGLSEQFVYLNDDIFFTGSVEAEDFFVDGLPCDYAREAPITVHDRMFAHININNILMLNEHYNRNRVLKRQRKKFYSRVSKSARKNNLEQKKYRTKSFFGFENYHMSSALLKSTCKAVWEQNYSWLDETCKNRFRSDNDVNQYVYLQYQYVNGLFHPFDWRGRVRLFRCNERNALKIASAIRRQRYSMVCINEADNIDFETTKSIINTALQEILPEKSRFEL